MERDLRRWFQRLGKAQIVILLLDTCFSGRTGGRTFEGSKPQPRSWRVSWAAATPEEAFTWRRARHDRRVRR